MSAGSMTGVSMLAQVPWARLAEVSVGCWASDRRSCHEAKFCVTCVLNQGACQGQRISFLFFALCTANLHLEATVPTQPPWSGGQRAKPSQLTVRSCRSRKSSGCSRKLPRMNSKARFFHLLSRLMSYVTWSVRLSFHEAASQTTPSRRHRLRRHVSAITVVI